jgi:hypothetical protein
MTMGLCRRYLNVHAVSRVSLRKDRVSRGDISACTAPQWSTLSYIHVRRPWSCFRLFIRNTSDIANVRTTRDLIASSRGSGGLICHWHCGRPSHGFTATAGYRLRNLLLLRFIGHGAPVVDLGGMMFVCSSSPQRPPFTRVGPLVAVTILESR